jgi:F-type H+-transporting ATPase subunit b
MQRRTVSILIIFFIAAAVFASQDTAVSEQQGIFSGTLADAIWAVTAFVVLLVILSRVAWKPLLRTLQSREDQIKNQLSSAENARLKAEKLLDEYKKQGLEIIEKTTSRANQMEKDVIEKTGKEAMMIKDRALSEIKAARHLAVQQLWQQLGDMLLAVNKEVLGRSVTTDDDKKLIDEAIAGLRQQQSSGTQK